MKLPLDSPRCFRLALTVVLVACTFAALGCGGDDKGGGGGGKLDVEADVDHFAGPTPLIVTLKATSKNADGDVSYRWRFDDGTSSHEAGGHQDVLACRLLPGVLDAHDESGNNDRGVVPLRSLAAQAVDEGAAQLRSRRRERWRPSEFSRSALTGAGRRNVRLCVARRVSRPPAEPVPLSG